MAEAQRATATAGKFTCVSCKLLFTSHNDQVEHYKGEFHRFNLKRKVADLPPVTLDVYEKKVQALKTADEPTAQVVGECTTCGKKFRSDGALQQHLNSRKHKEAVEAAAAATNAAATTVAGVHFKPSVPAHVSEAIKTKPADSTAATTEASPVTSEAGSPAAVKVEASPEVPAKEKTEDELIDEHIKNARKLELCECLFCLFKSKSLKSNLKHMTREHGFFIPDCEFLTNLDGFIQYLGEKISVGLTCVHCNGKGRSFQSLEAVQAHMRDLDHCKLAYEDNEDEYEEYYDFDALEDARGVIDDPKRPVFVDETSKELVLSGNKALGHRDNRASFKRKNGRELIVSLSKEYRILQAREEQKAKTPTRRITADQNWHHMKVGIAANTLQRYFRHQNPK